MPITTEYLKLNKPLYAEAADIEVLNGNMDVLDEVVREIHGRQKRRLIYITESQELTIPEGVYEIDVYLVNGGKDGSKPSEVALNKGNAPGGAGGAGGGCFFLPCMHVNPGDVYNVIVGAAGGGTTYFGTLGAEGLETAGGASGSRYDVAPSTGAAGKLPVLYGQLQGGRCPLDGNYYGVSGAAGGVSHVTVSEGDPQRPGTGGAAAVVAGNSFTPPQGGTNGSAGWPTYDSSASAFAGGGGGGSLDNRGEDGSAGTRNNPTYKAGNGADATTYGCGGGGGAGGCTSYMRAGVGGKGAQGVCIIAY